jgi:hypothetical protein
MTREERIKQIRERDAKRNQLVVKGLTAELPPNAKVDVQLSEIPVSREEVEETIHELDSVREWERDENSSKDALTSDES